MGGLCKESENIQEKERTVSCSRGPLTIKAIVERKGKGRKEGVVAKSWTMTIFISFANTLLN